MTDDKHWIRVPEAARLIGVSRVTAYRLLRRLAAEGVDIYKPSQRVTLVDRDSLEHWIERQHIRP